MKSSFYVLGLAGLMAFGTMLAQDAPGSIPVVPAAEPTSSTPAAVTMAPRGRGNPTASGARGAGGNPNAKPLDQNVTISIKGAVVKDTPLDISFTGCGPDFRLTKQISEVELNGTKEPIDATCEITITSVNDAFRIQYTVGCRIPMVNSTYTNAGAGGGMVTGTVTYTNASTSSALILKMGQTITAAASNGQSLTISLSTPVP